MRGDCTPAYSQHPWRSGVPERIRELAPEARFIYLVRDPVARVLAQVQHVQATGLEPRQPLRAALGDIDDPLTNRYLIPSLYATQVERYRKVFPAERMLVVDAADLMAERESTLGRIFGFLGVDETAAVCDFTPELNRGVEKRLHSRGYTRLRDSRLGAVWRRLPQRRSHTGWQACDAHLQSARLEAGVRR